MENGEKKCIHLPWVFVNVKKFSIFLPENGRWWSPLGSCTNQTSSSTFDHTSILGLQSKLVPQNWKKSLLDFKRFDLRRMNNGTGKIGQKPPGQCPQNQAENRLKIGGFCITNCKLWQVTKFLVYIYLIMRKYFRRHILSSYKICIFFFSLYRWQIPFLDAFLK